MTAPVILIEASPRRAADGVAETVLLAGGGGDQPYYYNAQHWRAGVVQLPTFITSLGFEGGEIGTGGVPQAAELQWSPTSKADLALMAAYFWVDAAISVRIGPEGAFPPIVLSGKVLDAPIEGGVLKIQLSDPAADLKKPLLTTRFAGTGGLEGPAEWDGKIRRRVWGRVWNIAGEPIDKANNVYCFADPVRQLQAIDAVRDMGAPAAALTTLGWQGSTAATFAALQAAAAPQGGGVICPSIACVKWWTQPAGDLTADLKGEIGAAYVETAPEIAQRIVQALAGPAFAAGTVAAAVAARGVPVGWVAKDDTTTAAAMIEELLGNVSLLWLLDGTGQIVIREWAWGASAAAATSVLVSRKKVLRPLATRKIGYQRNELPMARGDLAAIVLTTDITDPDGTPIDALIAAAQDTADAKRAVFYQSTPPSHLDSEENDLWINSADGNRLYRRVAGTGRLAIGGNRITIGGNYVTLAWTMADDQRVGQAVLDAAGAQATADGKATVFTMFSASEPVPVGEALGDLLVRLYASPVQVDHWSGSVWQTASTYGATLAQVAATTAAQSDATSALGQIGNIVADGVLDKSEKPDIVQRYNALTTEQSGIDAQATALGITTEKTAYDNAVSALTSYLTGLSPAYTSYTTDTAIDRSTFNTKFTDVYSARQALLNKIAAVAATKADWSSVAGAGKPADNATVGADWGTNLTSKPTELTDGRVSSGLNSDGTVKDNKVGTSAVVSGALTATTIVTGSGSSAAFSTVHELAAVTVGSLPSGLTGIKLTGYGQIKYTGGPTPGYPVLRLYRVPAANASAYFASGSGSARNPATYGSVVGKNLTLANWSNLDMGGMLQHSVTSPTAGDVYVIAADVITYPPAAGAWSYNWAGEIALDYFKR